MAIIKTYDMSTVEKVKTTYELVIQMQENQKYSNYNQDNIMLIRTTSIFPHNRIITTLSNSSFIAKSGMNFIHSAFYYELSPKILKKLETYELYYRSTIHFTENGLVSSHMYGNFDNQPFIILEPLSAQLDKSDFRNFAGQDTFIKGNVTLSEKAIIIIKTDNYELVKQTYPEIENFNVILYNGIPDEIKNQYLEENENSMAQFDINDQRAIVEAVLMDLGYTPELIGSHYIINSPTSDKIKEVNRELAKKYNVLAEEKHNYTQEYKDDFNKNLLISEIFNRLLLNFIIQTHNIDENIIIENGTITNDSAVKLVQLIGIDEIINDVDNFNKTIEKMNELGLLPTSNELLNNSIPNIYNYYQQVVSMNHSVSIKN